MENAKFFKFSKKKLNIDIWVPKMRFSKMYIFGAPIESKGPGMVSSYFVKSGLDKTWQHLWSQKKKFMKKKKQLLPL